ncbi:MAG: heparinase, partial [Lachnospiraceae bacterium]|nr:heparinase [Lachnospiraceae bacterium]
MLNQYLTEKTPVLPLSCFPKAGAEDYEKFSEARREKLIAGGEKYLGFEWPALPASLFLDLYRTGNRKHYEDPYFLRRTALS